MFDRTFDGRKVVCVFIISKFSNHLSIDSSKTLTRKSLKAKKKKTSNNFIVKSNVFWKRFPILSLVIIFLFVKRKNNFLKTKRKKPINKSQSKTEWYKKVFQFELFFRGKNEKKGEKKLIKLFCFRFGGEKKHVRHKNWAINGENSNIQRNNTGRSLSRWSEGKHFN